MLKEFHVGEFLKAEWDKRHLNMASVARSAGYTAANIRGMFERVHVNDGTLAKLSAASGVDFLALVKAERSRLGGYDEVIDSTAVREPMSPYGRSRANDLVIHLDDYEDAEQLRILRFIQQVPKRQR